MELCPHCHRRLISHASARCNWCGQVIDDPNYQAQAAVNREAYLTEQAIHDAQRLAWNASVNGVGPFGDPLFGPLAPADPILAQQYALDAAQRAAARARRLGPPLAPPAPMFPPQMAEHRTQPEARQVDGSSTPANKIEDLPGDEPAGNRFGHLELE